MRALLSILLLCVSLQLAAQNLTYYGILPAISQTGRISKKVDYNFFISSTIDAIPETINGVYYPTKDLQLYIQSSGIYKFSPNFNVAGSYTYQRNNPLTADYGNEHRFWEQFIFAHSFYKVKVTNRVRYEQRFIENRTTGEYPMSTRLRYQLGTNFPLQGKTLDVGEFYFNAYNEFYFSLSGAKNATYSENWTYAGVGYHTGKGGKIEMGYLMQKAVRNPAKDIRTLNLIQISWITNFNFFQKKK
jgi:hypothetical protein